MVMIYTNIVEFHSIMLIAKFQNHRPSGSEEDFKYLLFIAMSVSHLCNMTLTIYINFHCLFLHIKFGFDWPSGVREEDV